MHFWGANEHFWGAIFMNFSWIFSWTLNGTVNENCCSWILHDLVIMNISWIIHE
jgi:hypothetical protein